MEVLCFLEKRESYGFLPFFKRKLCFRFDNAVTYQIVKKAYNFDAGKLDIEQVKLLVGTELFFKLQVSKFLILTRRLFSNASYLTRWTELWIMIVIEFKYHSWQVWFVRLSRQESQHVFYEFYFDNLAETSSI